MPSSFKYFKKAEGSYTFCANGMFEPRFHGNSSVDIRVYMGVFLNALNQFYISIVSIKSVSKHAFPKLKSQ